MSRHDRNVRLLFGLAGASTAAILPFFVLWLRSRGMAPDRIGFVVAASALAAVVAAPVWSHAADMRLGTTRALVLSSAATAAAALLLLAVGPAFWPILVMVVAMAVAGAPGTALSDSLALNVLGPERETQYGSVRLWASLGWAGAVIVFGAWYQHAGLGAMLPLYAALTLIVAMVPPRSHRSAGPSTPSTRRTTRANGSAPWDRRSGRRRTSRRSSPGSSS